MILDLVPQYIFGELSRIKVLATGTVLFALLVIVARLRPLGFVVNTGVPPAKNLIYF